MGACPYNSPQLAASSPRTRPTHSKPPASQNPSPQPIPASKHKTDVAPRSRLRPLTAAPHPPETPRLPPSRESAWNYFNATPSGNASPAAQIAPSTNVSLFQIGTCFLSVSITQRHASNAAPRCALATATSTLVSPTCSRPKPMQHGHIPHSKPRYRLRRQPSSSARAPSPGMPRSPGTASAVPRVLFRTIPSKTHTAPSSPARICGQHLRHRQHLIQDLDPHRMPATHRRQQRHLIPILQHSCQPRILTVHRDRDGLPGGLHDFSLSPNPPTHPRQHIANAGSLTEFHSFAPAPQQILQHPEAQHIHSHPPSLSPEGTPSPPGHSLHHRHRSLRVDQVHPPVRARRRCLFHHVQRLLRRQLGVDRDQLCRQVRYVR